MKITVLSICPEQFASFLNIILAVAVVAIVIDALRCGGGPGK